MRYRRLQDGAGSGSLLLTDSTLERRHFSADEALAGEPHLPTFVERIIGELRQGRGLDGATQVQILGALHYFERAGCTDGLTMTYGRPTIAASLRGVEDCFTILDPNIDTRGFHVHNAGHQFDISLPGQHTALPLQVAIDNAVHVQDV
jgi:hypothetical protein